VVIYSKETIHALRRVADVTGILDKARISLLTHLDLQWKNQFEILFMPHYIPATVNKSDVALNVANIALDAAIASLHIQNISGIKLPDIEVIDINGIKHVTGITSPDDITMEFIENDLGLVRLFLQRWMNKIYTPMKTYNPVLDGFQKSKSAAGGGYEVNSNVNSEGTSSYYVFRDNQKAAKKDATIVLKGTTGLPTIGGWIKLEGLKLKSASGFDIGQKEEEPLMITATMSVDMVKFIVPLSTLI
jgi:hypothetical protein